MTTYAPSALGATEQKARANLAKQLPYSPGDKHYLTYKDDVVFSERLSQYVAACTYELREGKDAAVKKGPGRFFSPLERKLR